jgi:hypothetical protein
VTNVTPDQIKLKLQDFSELQKALDAEREKNGGMLPRHQQWRYHYYKIPYLAGSCSERIADRFRDVFINLSELTPDGKVGIRPGFETDDSLGQKFTHLLEEWNSRGGMPNDVVARARKPILKYFENGTPIGVTLFEGFKAPTTPFLVKYSRKEFLEPMLKTGKIRISPASYYNDAKHLDSVRDTETQRTFFIPTYRERLQGKKSIEFQGHTIHFGDDDIVIPVVVPNYFMFSLCDRVYYRLPTDFDANAALIIKDQNLFSQRVISAFLAAHPEWRPLVGNVIYYDPYIDYTKVPVPEMAKHFGYSYQREYRIAFQSKIEIKTTLVPEFINIGPMTEYAELLTL